MEPHHLIRWKRGLSTAALIVSQWMREAHLLICWKRALYSSDLVDYQCRMELDLKVEETFIKIS